MLNISLSLLREFQKKLDAAGWPYDKEAFRQAYEEKLLPAFPHTKLLEINGCKTYDDLQPDETYKKQDMGIGSKNFPWS